MLSYQGGYLIDKESKSIEKRYPAAQRKPRRSNEQKKPVRRERQVPFSAAAKKPRRNRTMEKEGTAPAFGNTQKTKTNPASPPPEKNQPSSSPPDRNRIISSPTDRELLRFVATNQCEKPPAVPRPSCKIPHPRFVKNPQQKMRRNGVPSAQIPFFSCCFSPSIFLIKKQPEASPAPVVRSAPRQETLCPARRIRTSTVTETSAFSSSFRQLAAPVSLSSRFVLQYPVSFFKKFG